jgi:hypothetical protein
MIKSDRFLLAHDHSHSYNLDVMLVGVALMFAALFVSVTRYKPQPFPTMTNQGQFQNTFDPALSAGKTNLAR